MGVLRSVPDTVGDDRVVDLVSWVFVFGTSLIQTRNLTHSRERPRWPFDN